MTAMVQSFTTESPIVDTTAASLTGQQVCSHLDRLSAHQAKATEEREKGSMLSKPSIEGRKLGRKIIRPPLGPHHERPSETSADAEIPGMESSSVTEEAKPSASHEPEVSVGTSLSHAPSSRKQLASSSLSEPRQDSVAQEASTDIVLSLKKSKHALEGSTDVLSVHPSSETCETVQQSTVPSDISKLQPVPTEYMETDQAVTLSNDEIIDEVKAEEDIVNLKEEMEEQKKETIGGTNQEDEVPYEGDAIMDELSEKPNTMMELADETQKSENVNDLLQPSVESEDEREEREEGEFMPDDSEQEEDIVSGDIQNEFITGDGCEIGDEGVDASKVASPVVPAERSEEDAIEDVAEASDKHNGNDNDQCAPDPSQSPRRSTAFNNNDQAAPPDSAQSPDPGSAQSPKESAAVREGSPASLPRTSVSEFQSPGPRPSTVAIETDEPAPTHGGGRKISISEKAKENAKLRQSQQARMTTPSPPRGRHGRAVGSVRILIKTTVNKGGLTGHILGQQSLPMEINVLTESSADKRA